MIQLSFTAYALLRAFQNGCLAALVEEPFKVWVFSGAADEYCRLWPRTAFTELAARDLIACAPDNVWYISETGRAVP